MYEILKNPQFDFMGRRNLLLGLSIVLVVASLAIMPLKGIDLGTEFTGGTELQLKYSGPPSIGAIRAALERAGLAAQVTTIGELDEHEISIRLAQAGAVADQEDPTGAVIRALRAGTEQPGKLDLNLSDEAALRDVLSQMPGLASESAQEIALGISARRKQADIYDSIEQLRDVPGMTAETFEYLSRRSYAGPLALRSQSFIGPAVGAELMHKAELAIVMSLIMVLVYIWIRFQVQWGVAAVAALVHDTLVTLGLFALLDKELSLPVVAAFLTLIGYSVNDTVVVFDRIRENLRNRATGSLDQTINTAINQTLSRTIITSGLTWVVCLALYLFGGPALDGFAFVLTFGILIGTYSSITVASPILILWSRLLGKTIAAAAPAPAPGPRSKVQSSRS